MKSWLTGKDSDAGKDWGQEEYSRTEDETVGWHHWLNGHGFVQTLGYSTGKSGVLQSMELQRVRHSWVTEQQQNRWEQHTASQKRGLSWQLRVLRVKLCVHLYWVEDTREMTYLVRTVHIKAPWGSADHSGWAVHSGPPLQLPISTILAIALSLRFSILSTRGMEKVPCKMISNLKIQQSNGCQLSPIAVRHVSCTIPMVNKSAISIRV